MQQQLKEHRYEIVPSDQKTDIYIIGTCSVTNIVNEESRQMPRRAKRMSLDSVVVVARCYAQVTIDILGKNGCVGVVMRGDQKVQLARILNGCLGGREDSKARVLDIDHTNGYEPMWMSRISGHSRAFIKVQGGYSQFYSYCIIPCARGGVRSRNPEDVVEEVKGLMAQGYKEVILTGIHLSSYGIEHLSDGLAQGENWDHTALLGLILGIHEIPGLERVRLDSLGPRTITMEFAGMLVGLSKFYPHLHLSLQSDRDETLERMNHRYTTRDCTKRYSILRNCSDHPAITADTIVGFPGETREEFTATRGFPEQVHFFEIHALKCPRRGDTRAANIPDQVPEPAGAARSNILLDLEAVMSKEYEEWFIGRQVSVFFEEMMEVRGNMYMMGHTPQYVKAAPAVNGSRGDRLRGAVHTLKAMEFLRNDLLQIALP